MKQLGNLAIICAQRQSVLLHIQDGMVSVFVGEGPDRDTYSCSPANPTMASCKQKVQESSSFSVHKAEYLSLSSVYAGI